MATTVLIGLIYIICEKYLDDCGNAQFLERLGLVFQRIRLKGLLVKAKECKFGLSSIEYVGKVISSDGLSMSKAKIESVLNFPRPKGNTSLRALLGLANYFRGFVPEHSTIVAPLNRMVDQKGSQRSSVSWTDESIKAFQDIPIAISRCPLMDFIDGTSPVRLYTDASASGIGGVLFQIVNDVWKPIEFVSKSLTAVQLKWSTIQTEAYAIFICCTQLGYLLLDRPFTLHTGHYNLTFMTGNSSSMVARWYIALQEFDYTIHFLKGSQNTIADALSLLCPNLAELALPLQEPATPEPGQLLSALHVVPPPDDDQLEALRMYHNSIIGHGVSKRTVAKLISLDHNWPYMRQHVKLFIRQCPCCQKSGNGPTNSMLRHSIGVYVDVVKP
jgi:RNase H-like domain found in reverse transcriptase/Integrase zinc binding domain